MKPQSKFLHFLGGLAIVLAVIILTFSFLIPWTHTYGATPEELSRTYHGDELITEPIVNWTHGITINATPEKVWPWIIQIGDSRAAFYSFTFIENMFGDPDAYHNADRVHPEWQNPPIDQGIIIDFLKIKEYEVNQFMLASEDVPDMNWTWLWWIEPEGENATRLIIRMRIEVPGQAGMSVLGEAINLTGFVMEVGMLNGLKARAEGMISPAYEEPLGIFVWLLVFAVGVYAAVLYMKRRESRLPLALGLVVIIVLFIFTYAQPNIWLRVAVDVLLCGAVFWVWKKK
ncbi:MAG: hypothetical protein AB9891_14215 [Anaerolineaceae bacterium]